MEKGFRWRGGEIIRIEGFTDAVFAFAVTLLVVSLEVPQSFAELLRAMRGFLAFGVCFTLLMTVWHDHYLFFRRYGSASAACPWGSSPWAGPRPPGRPASSSCSSASCRGIWASVSAAGGRG